MADAGRELGELKREIIEARNQAIKTDNQVKNLALDVKGFEKRFDGLDKRVRLSSIGVNVIIALTVSIAAYGVASMRGKAYQASIAELRREKEVARTAGEEQIAQLKGRLADFEKRRQEHHQAEQLATTALQRNREKQEKEAVAALEKLQPGHLGELERELFEQAAGDLRRRGAEAAYKNARSFITSNRFEAAVPELRRALVIEPNGRLVGSVRYYLAVSLWNLKRWEEVEPLLKSLHDSDADKSVVEEARYMLGVTLAQQGKREEAKALLTRLVGSAGRYEKAAKTQLAAMEGGGG